MNLKARLNHQRYLEALSRMTPAQRLGITMELSDRVRAQLRHALRKLYPDADDHQIHKLYLEKLSRCHNRNY